jgi:hypothetical protein
MFERQREKRRLAHQQKAEAAQRAAQDKAAAAWQEQHDAYQHVLELARDFQGEQSSEIVLKKGEALFGKLDSASLVEDRAGQGEWKGRSQGVSIPIGSLGGRSVRYRVGASKGHYVQGAPVATAIDIGTIFITNRRVIFRGHKQNRECLFDKLISCEHLDSGESVIAVSNRQKNTVLHYGPGLNAWFRIHYEVAFADYKARATSSWLKSRHTWRNWTAPGRHRYRRRSRPRRSGSRPPGPPCKATRRSGQRTRPLDMSTATGTATPGPATCPTPV